MGCFCAEFALVLIAVGFVVANLIALDFGVAVVVDPLNLTIMPP